MTAVVVYGAGAVGGVIAARLHLAGVDVTAVARGEHLRAIQRGGLNVVSQDGTSRIDLRAVPSAAEVDWNARPVTILAVKSHQTAAALDDLTAHAPTETPVFVAQNGVANEAAVLRRFANVHGVAVVLSAAHLEPGVVVQQSHPVAGILDLGRYPSGRDGVSEELAAVFRSAWLLSEVRDDIMAWKHRKLIANLANGVTATFRPGPEADELVARARAEAERILTQAAIPFVSAGQDIQRRNELVSSRVRQDYFGSTWQSLARGHVDVETDWFNGEIVLQARLLGEAAPVNEFIQWVTAEHARLGRPPRSLDAAGALAQIAEYQSVAG